MKRVRNKRGETQLRRFLLGRFRGSRVRPTIIRPARGSDFAMELKIQGRRGLDQLSTMIDKVASFDANSVVTFQGSAVGSDQQLTIQIHVQWPTGDSDES